MAQKHRKKKARQVAALAYRRTADGAVEVLVMTSRDTHRPVIPKGWPMKGRKDRDSAALEAFQEAGVQGKVSRKPIGSYHYWKRLEDSFVLAKVHVYALEVRRQSEHFQEEGQRLMAWLPQADAAALIDDPELATLIGTVRL